MIGSFATMLTIQNAAFLMTLRRKKLIGAEKWKYLYGAMLALTGLRMMCIPSWSYLIQIIIVSSTDTILRTQFGMNKYILMTGAFISSFVLY